MILTIFFLSWILSSILYFKLISNILWLIPVWIIAGLATGFLVFGLILIITLPFFYFTKPNRAFKHYFVKDVSRFINFLVGIKVTAVGRENIPKNGKLTVYANHKSKDDPFIISAYMNRNLAFTPKISVYKIPVAAQYMHAIGCLPIDRNDNRRTAKTLIGAIKNVENGLAMLIFPEGGILSRNEDKMVGLKAGAYKIGVKSGSDFLPVSLIGTSKIATKKWWKRVSIKIVFHPVVKFEEVKELNTTELGEKMFEIINSVLE